MDDSGTGVAVTAYLTAAARRDATGDSSSGFYDPYAARFAAQCPPSMLRALHRTAGGSVLVERSRIVDALLAELVAATPVDVVVNLGAGFDARPYRLSLERAVRFIEVDTDWIVQEKERLLPSAECAVPLQRVACDLRDLERLRSTLSRSSAAGGVLVLSEGVLTYLAPADLRGLARTLAELSGVRGWVCDVLSGYSAGLLESALHASAPSLRMHGLDDLSVFEQEGWTCLAYRTLSTASAVRRSESGVKAVCSGRVLDGVLHLAQRASGGHVRNAAARQAAPGRGAAGRPRSALLQLDSQPGEGTGELTAYSTSRA